MTIYYKKDLIKDYSVLAKITEVEATKRISAIFNLVGGQLAEMTDGDAVMLAGYFNHHVKIRKAKPGNNPQTGAPMTIGATKTIVTKLTKPLKGKIRGVVSKAIPSVEGE
jgi:nucleoid DNA-binding protein